VQEVAVVFRGMAVGGVLVLWTHRS
jgi:hypothetical protein